MLVTSITLTKQGEYTEDLCGGNDLMRTSYTIDKKNLLP